MNRLPRITSSRGDVVLVCPWCREDMGEATVRLADLVEGWEDVNPGRPGRSEAGLAGSPLVTDCPTCAHPSMVALDDVHVPSTGVRRFVRLVPVRTKADVRLIGGDA